MQEIVLKRDHERPWEVGTRMAMETGAGAKERVGKRWLEEDLCMLCRQQYSLYLLISELSHAETSKAMLDSNEGIVDNAASEVYMDFGHMWECNSESGTKLYSKASSPISLAKQPRLF
jgi:hypothetical protein